MSLTVGLSLAFVLIGVLALTALASGLLALLSAIEMRPAPDALPTKSSELSRLAVLVLVYGFTGVAVLVAISLAWWARPRTDRPGSG